MLSASAKRQRVCKPGSVHRRVGGWATIPLGRRSRAASSNQPGRRAGTRPMCRPYSVLLPVGFTVPLLLPGARCALTAPFHRDRARNPAVCSLLHCPWGRPRRALPATVVSVEPGLSSRTEKVPAAARPSDAKGSSRGEAWAEVVSARQSALCTAGRARPCSAAARGGPCYASSPCGFGRSSASRIMRHSASISPSTSSGRKRRWNATIAAIGFVTS